MFEERHADPHQDGGDAGLQNGDGLERDALTGASEKDDVEGEGDGAAEGEPVSEVDGGEFGPVRAGRKGEQRQAGECEERTEDRPDGRLTPEEQVEEERNQDHGDAGNESGFRRRGEAEAGGLEGVSGEEEDADGECEQEFGSADPSEAAIVGGGEHCGRHGEAHRVEEQRRDVTQRILDEHKRGAPDKGDEHQQQVRFGGARHYLVAASYTVFPATMVRITLVPRMSGAEIAVRSRSRTTMSAYLPGSRVPLCFSANSAKAEPVV